MENRILPSIKKLLQIVETYEVFDPDITLHINTAFSTLNQLGVGPTEGFMIEDSTTTWDAFLENDNRLNGVKTYIFLRTKMMFDPPTTSYLLDAYKSEIQQLEWRLQVVKDGDLPIEQVVES